MEVTLDWQIAGPIIGVAVPVALFFWARREKVKIKITGLDCRVHGIDRKLTVYLGNELQRSGGKEIRYITQVLLKPEKQTYGELRNYFNLPDDGLIRFGGRIKLPSDTIVPLYKPQFATYPEFAAVSRIQEDELGSIQAIADKLSQKTHRVGLVWEDSGKTTWKTVSKEDYGKWI
jgi:hypothetical protein